MTDAARLTGPQELLQIAAVATQYYQQGRSKVDIAQDLGMSRFRVARLLTAARELGIVRIDITVPDAINADLSVELATASGLRQAIVVDTPDEPVSTLRADLGRVAANLLAELVQEDDVVGIAWGRTVNAMTAALSDIKRCSIVQMTGALSGAEVSDNAIELVRRMSQISWSRLPDLRPAPARRPGRCPIAAQPSQGCRSTQLVRPNQPRNRSDRLLGPAAVSAVRQHHSTGTTRASRRRCPRRHQHRPA